MAASSVVESGFAPVALKTGQALELALQRLWLRGRVLPAGARLMVEHVFRSAEKRPIEVVYAFALPRDAALRRFRINGEGFSVRSELKPVEEAARAYERGLEEGRLAALARQYRDGLINLTVGNVRPGETVTVSLEILAGVEAHDDGLRFRFPFTLAPSYHPRARVSVQDGVGEMELPEEEFGDLMLPRFSADAAGLHEVGFALEVSMDRPVSELASPSHAVRVLRQGDHSARVLLAPEKDVPNRDLVLEVGLEPAGAGALTGIDRTGKRRFAVTVPSHSFGSLPEAPRRVVFVLDRSGSMDGAPIRQARKAVEACLGALSPEDSFGIVIFDDKAEAFRGSLAPGTMENREEARRFLAGAGARGGTELAGAVRAGAQVLGENGGDLLVLTDGQVFGTENILAQARAVKARLHCLGIGSASQDRFLALLARETGAVSRFVTARERVDLMAVDLFASLGRPVASELRVSGPGVTLAPEPPPYAFAGSPLVLFGQAEADGRLAIAFKEGGPIEVPLRFSDSPLGETLRLIAGARLLTDAAGRGAAPEEIEALSREFGLASSRMALVAVVERAGDRPGEVPVTRVVPVGMPQDTPFEAYFQAPMTMGAFSLRPPARPGAARLASFTRPHMMASAAAPPPAAEDSTADVLLDAAAHISADGGMPGGNDEDRVIETAIALLELLAGGNTANRGPFRRHVRRLIAFLENAIGAQPPERAELLERLLDRARRGEPVPGLVSRADFWRELAQAL